MRNPLDELFGAEPEESFVDFLKTEGIVADDDMSRITSDRPSPVVPPQFLDQVSGLIRIQNGWHGTDYVWHISPDNERRPWRVPLASVIKEVATIMNKTIPSTVQVRIWMPRRDWDIPEITFKAFGLGDEWSINTKLLEQMSQTLFQKLNSLV